jgi:hypothetical protein
VAHQRAQGDLGGTLRGGERADPDVHRTATQREDPAVAGQDLVVLAAQLEVRADPRVVGHRGVDVRARGDAVDGVPVPGAAEQLAQRGAHAVGDDQPPTAQLEGVTVGLEPHRGHPAAVHLHVDRAGAVDADGTRLHRGRAEMVVELGARHRRPVGRQLAARPGQQQGLAEPVCAQTVVDGMRTDPVVESEPVELGDRAGRQAVTTGLVAREDGRVDQHRVASAARGPRGSRRARWAGADDEHIGAGLGGGRHRVILSGRWARAHPGQTQIAAGSPSLKTSGCGGSASASRRT